MKKHAMKTFTPVSAVAAVFGLAALGVNAATTPVFEYSFPASWNGTGSTIVDQSSAGDNGTYDGTLSLAPVPAPAPGNAINTSAGGILDGTTAVLNNTAVAAAGGFTYNCSLMWNGGTTGFAAQNIIDYAGTETLRLGNIVGGTSADLQAVFDATSSTGTETVANSMSISPNTWYNVQLTFDTTGQSVAGDGSLTGIATMYVDGSSVGSASATKGTYGDSLNRPIGVGQLGAPFGYLVGFQGSVYDPSVSLGVPAPVPEPSTLALGALGGLAMLGLRRRKF